MNLETKKTKIKMRSNSSSREEWKNRSRTEENNRGRDHKGIDEDQEAKMQSPIPLELTQVALRRLLVVNLEFVVVGGGGGGLDLPELLGGEAESELVAAALVLEAVDAAEGVGDGDVEAEMGNGEERNWDPGVAALEPRGQGLGQEHEAEEDEEQLEQIVEVLLLEIYGAFLLEGLLEMELDYGVQGLEGRVLGDRWVLPGLALQISH